MKISILAALGAAMVSLVAYPALAQVSTFEATVPFPFIVGNHTLPEGTYTVQRLMGHWQRSGHGTDDRSGNENN